MDENGLAAAVDLELDDAIASGQEVGVQVTVIRGGRTLVDTARGVGRPSTGAAVDRDTLFWAASTAKGVPSTVAHVLIEQLDLRDDLRVVEVWAEFGAYGKDEVTLRHVLEHRAGVPFLPPDTSVEELCDWEHMCALIADARPAWVPGTRFGYHARTFGYLLGEIVRRVTGTSISSVLRARITGPIGAVDDVHFGVPGELLPRLAEQVAADGDPPPAARPGSPAARAIPPAVRPDVEYANRPDVLCSDIVSEGTMSARGVARLYSALLGHVEGVTLVSPERLAKMAAVTFEGTDEVMGLQTSWAYGYSPFRPSGHACAGSTFGMIGMNGSAAYADIDSGVAVALMRNRFTVGDLTTITKIDRLIQQALDDERTTHR